MVDYVVKVNIFWGRLDINFYIIRIILIYIDFFLKFLLYLFIFLIYI